MMMVNTCHKHTNVSWTGTADCPWCYSDTLFVEVKRLRAKVAALTEIRHYYEGQTDRHNYDDEDMDAELLEAERAADSA